MYKCSECGHLFEDGEQKIENSYLADYGNQKIFEHHSCCPVCNGDYEEVKPCALCGGYIHMTNGDKFCDACKVYIKNKFQIMLKLNFNEDEKELLNELYDGREF